MKNSNNFVYLYRGCEICKFSIAFKYKHKIKWPKLLRKCIFRNSKKILGFNKYESVWFIIYTNFVVQTVKNSNPLEVFCENVLLSAIIYIKLAFKVCTVFWIGLYYFTQFIRILFQKSELLLSVMKLVAISLSKMDYCQS